LSKPLPAADPELYRIVRQHAQEKIDKREKTQSLVYCVTDYIADALKHGDATLADAADTLGMTSRALQRELEKANTSFRDLVEETRKSMARHYLNDTSLPLTEIAFILGFSELSAFSRAARSWFGASPRELRKVGTEKSGY
jgi:AraC-like DNA-binding protein